MIEIRSTDNKDTYELFYTGPNDNKHHGVGIIFRKDLKADYKEIMEKNCVATFKLEKQNRNLKPISKYAPTLEVSEKDENIGEEFYGALNNKVNGINRRDILIIAGDMDAKIGSEYHVYPECIERFGKGKMNNNGKHLAEFALLSDIFLTNTNFKHKTCHRTTWTGLERRNEFKDKNGEVRRNPFRNQIDYILIKRRDLPLVRNSHTYGDIGLNTNHKIVKAELQIEWIKMKISKKKRCKYRQL